MWCIVGWCILIAIIYLAGQSEVHAQEVGVASTFSDRIVACPPKRINPHTVMGIAHRTLPCGTRVEVTNLYNGRKVVAMVVDLGPCTTWYCQHRMPKRIRLRKFDLLPPVARAIRSSGLVKVSVVQINHSR